MLHLTFAEAALERIPRQLWFHPSVTKKAKREGKHPGHMLLDRTYHHMAMERLRGGWRRGRPDIVHFSLLEALGTPLNREGLLRTYVHTIDNYLIFIDSHVRLPKNYTRFTGLIEQLYELGRVPKKGQILLKLEKGTFKSLLEKIKPSYIIAFSRRGEPKPLQKVFENHRDEKELMVVVGAFPRGSFSKLILNEVNELISIDKMGLETWIVTSRIIYSFERILGIPVKRLG